MKDESGRVLVKDFYKGIEPLSALEKQAIKDAPDVDAQIMQEICWAPPRTRRRSSSSS